MAPAAGDGLKLHFELHFGSRVKYDPASGQWLPLEDELTMPEDLLVLQRMKACLSPVLPWPPSVEVVHAVAAQCGVLPIKRRIRLRSSIPSQPSQSIS